MLVGGGGHIVDMGPVGYCCIEFFCSDRQASGAGDGDGGGGVLVDGDVWGVGQGVREAGTRLL